MRGQEHFHYFMIRLARSSAEPERLSGLVECIGSGEKRTFGTGEELIHLFTSWSIRLVNMSPGQTDRNAELKA
jgi:hypothetical protein